MRRLLTFLLALAALAASAVPANAARAVRNGVITVGWGAGGIDVGMKRAEVVATLGTPFYENRNGYMQYMPDDGRGIFDVYRAGGGRGTRVRMISVSSFGRHFTVDDGIPIFEAGGLRALGRAYGRRLRLVRTSDGELIYRIVTRAYGRRIDTDFTVTRPNLGARVMQVFVVKIS